MIEEDESLRDLILTDYEFGETFRAIAERHGVSKTRAHQIVKEAAKIGIVNIEGIKARRARQGIPIKSRNPQRDAKIVSMREDGASYTDIAKEMDMHRGTVMSVCRRFVGGSA